MNTKDGGPAFPSSGESVVDGYRRPVYRQGMTLRDYFAAKAMTGMLASWGTNQNVSTDELAKAAYIVADGMLAAQENPNG